MTFELQRMCFLMRNYVSKRMLEGFNGSISVFAEDIGEHFAFYLNARVMGQRKRVEIDGGPDGRWQMVRALFGLPYRRRNVVVEAYALFPHIPASQDRVVYTLETENGAGIPEVTHRRGDEVGRHGSCSALPPGLRAEKSLPPPADA